MILVHTNISNSAFEARRSPGHVLKTVYIHPLNPLPQLQCFDEYFMHLGAVTFRHSAAFQAFIRKWGRIYSASDFICDIYPQSALSQTE